MEISISNLYNKFNIFSYSTFQKYKNDKCNNKLYFTCKKDFYKYLEYLYELEFKSRKKIFDLFDEKEFFLLSLLKINEFDENLSTIVINQLLNETKLISIFNIENFEIGKEITQKEKILFFLKLSNKINTLKQKYNWSEFDEFILFQIITNLKRFYSLIEHLSSFFKIDSEKNTITIFPRENDFNTDEINSTKLIFNIQQNNNINIYEEENINNKIVKTKLKEAKWILKAKGEKYTYMDHKFNFLTIDTENKKIFYNGIEILGSKVIFQTKINHTKIKTNIKTIKKYKI
jgi:hypothetical protein